MQDGKVRLRVKLRMVLLSLAGLLLVFVACLIFVFRSKSYEPREALVNVAQWVSQREVDVSNIMFRYSRSSPNALGDYKWHSTIHITDTMERIFVLKDEGSSNILADRFLIKNDVVVNKPRTAKYVSHLDKSASTRSKIVESFFAVRSLPNEFLIVFEDSTNAYLSSQTGNFLYLSMFNNSEGEASVVGISFQETYTVGSR